ncbi:MAG: hypothetical protein ACXABO_14020 [Promethearchaeota archaeon]
MTETKDPTIIEYENIIEELIQENDALKKKISELEEENNLLKLTEYSFQEPITTPVQKEKKKSSRSFKRSKIKEKFESMAKKKEGKSPTEPVISRDTTTLEPDLFTESTTPSLPKHSLIEGTSRRECPICNNTLKAFIHEITDKTNIIMAYPRVYGKKYKCGKCGQEWKIPTSLE